MKIKKTRTIGRVEKIDFPDFNLFEIDAKVDTGAYTSAIHCHDIVSYEDNGAEMVSFKLLDPSHPAYNHKEIILPVKARRKIKNSFGQVQKRIIVQARMKIYNKVYKVELSLADRSKLEYPVLLGRKALYNRFIVDVSQKNVAFSLKQKSINEEKNS